MVGVPRSTGCQLCVKRRVKCDRNQPSCGNCAKYGAPCPGYDRPLKFVAGKHHVRPRRQEHCRGWGTEPAPGFGGHTPSRTAVPADSTASSMVGTPSSPSAESSSQLELSAELPLLYLSPSADRGQTIAAIIQSLHSSQAAADIGFFAPWFRDVPRHLGQKVALDGAMAAFALHLLGKANQDDVLVRQSRSIYGQSIGALQKALNHPVEWKSSETLCATMMLSLFELFAGTGDWGSWMKHAAGVSWLLQQRGPEAHRGDWDRSMLVSFRVLTIMHTLFAGQDCFLARKPWQQLLAENPVTSATTGATVTQQLHTITDRYLNHLARLPAILHRGYALREANLRGLPIDRAQTAILARRAERLLSEVTALSARHAALAPEPTEVPSRDPGSPYATVLSHGDVWHGSFRMSCWATLLILQECLAQCGYAPAAAAADSYRASNRELARNIYRSVELVGAGLLGPFRVGYALRVAYEFADLRTQRWITSLLAGFERTYASTGVSGYPEPGPNEYQFS